MELHPGAQRLDPRSTQEASGLWFLHCVWMIHPMTAHSHLRSLPGLSLLVIGVRTVIMVTPLTRLFSGVRG